MGNNFCQQNKAIHDEAVPSKLDLDHPYVKASLGYEDAPKVESDDSVQSQILAADYAWGKGDTELAIEILDKIDCSEAWAQYYVEGLRSLINGDMKKSFEAYNKIDDVFAANRAVDVAFWGSDSAGMFNASEKLQNKVKTHPYAGGVRAFAQHVVGDHKGAETTANSALDAGFCDPWTIHAVAHVMYAEGRLKECLDWLDQYKDISKFCGSFMRGHFAFHETLCFVDLEDVSGVEKMLQSTLWDGQSDSDRKDYWNATCVLNVLWKCHLRDMKAPYEYVQKALASLDDFDASKSKVFSLCILRWNEDALRKILDVKNDALTAFAHAVHSAYYEENWQAAYEHLAPYADDIDILGASPEQREVVTEFVGTCLLKADANATYIRAIWNEQYIRPNVKYYEQFESVRG